MAKESIIFITSYSDEPDSFPLFRHLAVYQLRSHLRRLSDLSEAFEYPVIPWRLHGTGITNDEYRYVEVLQAIRHLRPRAVAFSLYVWTLESYHELASLIRRTAPEILLFAGGPEVAERERFVEEFPAFDVLVEGAGEIPFAEALRRLREGNRDLSGIPNVSFRRPDGGFVHNPPGVSGNEPERDPWFFKEHQELIGGPVYHLCTSGCNLKCTYCLWPSRRVRRQSPGGELAEIEAILSSKRVTSIVMFDFDLLEAHRGFPEWFSRLGHLLRAHGEPPLSFFTTPRNATGASFERLTREVRIDQVFLGIQSMCPDALRAVGRGWSVPQLRELENIPAALRKKIVIELMVPLPGETPQSFLKGLERLVGLGYYRFQIFPVLVLRGTALRKSAETLGLRFFPRPPYLCHETPTFPFRDWLDACTLSDVMNLLTFRCQATEWECLAELYQRSDSFIQDLACRVRDGTPARQIADDLLSSIGIGEISPLSGHPVYDVNIRERFPSETVFRTVLERHGMRWQRERLMGDMLEVFAEIEDRHVVLKLFPVEKPETCYRAGSRLKIAYRGVLHDLTVLDELLTAAHVGSRDTASPGDGMNIPR